MELRDVEQHLLRRNHSRALPQRMVFLDTETREEVIGHEKFQTFQYGWTCYIYQDKKKRHNTEKWKFHTDSRRLWKYIISLALDKQPLWLFAHNAYYDLQASGFFHYFKKWKWRRTIHYDKGITYLLGVRRHEKSIKVVSTTNYFQTTLAEMGKMARCYKHPVNPLQVDRETGMIYCFRDVEIIVETIMRYRAFVLDHDLGSFRMTRASQSFSAYRHRFMNARIMVHRDQGLTELERACHFGGRCECFQLGRIGDGPFFSLDVNSMYPYVMQQFPVPVKYVDYIEHPSQEKVRAVLDRHLVVAEVVVETEEPCYAYRDAGRLLFPVGRFRTGLCTMGLRHALENGRLVSVERMITYEGGRIFNDFVNYFHKLRGRYELEKNKIYANFCKYILTSLYGKFGQMHAVVEEEEDFDGPDYYRHLIFDNVTGELEIVTQMLNISTVESGEEPAPTSMIAIPAHITEYARFLLWRIITEIGPDRVLYCDTDSIKVRCFDLPRLTYPVDAEELGALRIDKQIQELTIWGPKDYIEDGDVRLKGIPKTAEKVSWNTYKYDTWLGQTSHLERQESRRFILSETTKTLSRRYRKGQVDKKGRVRPLRIAED